MHNKVEKHKDYQRGIKLAEKEFWTNQSQSFRVYAGPTSPVRNEYIGRYRRSRTKKNEFLIMGYLKRCRELGIPHNYSLESYR